MPADYNQYMNTAILADRRQGIQQEIGFWQKRLKADTGNFVYKLELGRCYLDFFKVTGSIDALQKGDSLMIKSSARLNDSDPELLFSLAQNSITKHQFKQAAFYTEAAEKKQGDLYTIRLLAFDAFMELGEYEAAWKSLQGLKEKTAFDYLVRRAKWEDHKGNLQTAIHLMEQAFEKVKSKNKIPALWALANLADMYGHAGKIKEAYRAYLDVLKSDPANLYCLKGIAWIAYAHDNNPAEAKRIIEYILTQSNMPDLYLLLAEIAEMQGQPQKQMYYFSRFLTEVSHPAYGDMYNKYLIQLYAEGLNQPEKAMPLAIKEMNNRFTPETCSQLAWVYYLTGDYPKAFEMANAYVYKHSFEPELMLQTAFIFAENGKKKEAKTLLRQCLESAFELGPLVTGQVKKKLVSL
jgi:tetratricopeptide (TPR) repeat protein